jgi:hypothetical protein
MLQRVCLDRGIDQPSSINLDFNSEEKKLLFGVEIILILRIFSVLPKGHKAMIISLTQDSKLSHVSLSIL